MVSAGSESDLDLGRYAALASERIMGTVMNKVHPQNLRRLLLCPFFP